MRVGEIVTRVRAAIDELMVNDSSFLRESEDEQNLTAVIVSKIGYALQYVIEHAPLEKIDTDLLRPLSGSGGTFYVDADLVGHLKLPKNLLRIVDARLSSWSQFPIPQPSFSETYLMQQDKYARGTYDRPVNILTYNGSDRYLEMYSAKDFTDTLLFSYIGKPSEESYSHENMNQEVSVPAQLEAALVYQIAGLSMLAFREDVANSLLAVAERYLESGTVRRNEE